MYPKEGKSTETDQSGMHIHTPLPISRPPSPAGTRRITASIARDASGWRAPDTPVASGGAPLVMGKRMPRFAGLCPGRREMRSCGCDCGCGCWWGQET